ncbi:DoxX family protein [Streptomyces anulatus]|uniref:DoxX family protein n=1 Tax=Streptomyces anulatus TaxID=1892 RepID=UPI0036653615
MAVRPCVLLAFALGASAVLTFTRNEAITASMGKVGVPGTWFPWLASLKAAGALGLLIGLGVPLIGSAAAIGVVLYFIAGRHPGGRRRGRLLSAGGGPAGGGPVGRK